MAEPTTSSHAAGDRRSSRRLPWLVLATAAVLVLGACSAIPPQSVTDPLGLDGQQVSVAFPGSAGAHAVTGTGGDTFVFADVDIDLVLSPGAMTNTIGIASARLSGPAGPATITITDPVLTVRVWHGADSYADAATDDRVEASLITTAPIVLKLGTCFPEETGPCNYTYQSGPTSFGDLKLSGTPLSTLLQIITEAPTPNGGSAQLTLQADPDDLAGRTLTLTLEASEGEIRF